MNHCCISYDKFSERENVSCFAMRLGLTVPAQNDILHVAVSVLLKIEETFFSGEEEDGAWNVCM